MREFLKNDNPDFWTALLRCPVCGGELALSRFSRAADGSTDDGLLACGCGLWYPVSGGIPRLIAPGPLRPDDAPFLEKWAEECATLKPLSRRTGDETKAQQVQQSFEYKWKRFSRFGLDGPAAQFLEGWLFSRHGWESREEFRACLSDKAACLDAGCGMGRDTVRLARANPKMLVIGMDLSECVEEARENAATLPNARFVQADLTAPPFEPGVFDLIFSEGVLHHTPDTRRSFAALVRLLAPGGEFSFYVYAKKSPMREFADDFIRQQVSSMSAEECFRQMESLTKLGRALSEIRAELVVPEDVEVLGIKAGKYDIQRFVYWNLFKCFWNDDLEFEECVMNNFDWYHPKYCRRHTPDEVRAWVEEAGLETTHEDIGEAGITVRAKRKRNGGGR